MKIKILHLFYDLMNLYGEYGNINILKSHLEDQGIEVQVDKKSLDDDITFDDYDFIYVGSGTEKNQELMLSYLQKYKKQFKKYIDSNKYALFTGNSFEVMGKTLTELNGEKEELLGFCDFDVERFNTRITGDTILSGDLIEEKLVGFINKQSNIVNLKEPLFNVEFGIGADKDNKIEGVRLNNFFGTYLIGPLLIKNPKILCFFVKEIIKLKENNFQFKDIDYRNEEEGYNITLHELLNRRGS